MPGFSPGSRVHDTASLGPVSNGGAFRCSGCGNLHTNGFCPRHHPPKPAILIAVWEIRQAEERNIEILRNITGADRPLPLDGFSSLKVRNRKKRYGFAYRKSGYANWGRILKIF